MSPTTQRRRAPGYSRRAITRFQFVMLKSMEADRSLSEAMQDALNAASDHPDWDVFERRPYRDWAGEDGRETPAAASNPATATTR